MTSVAYGIAMPATRGAMMPPIYCAQAGAFFARLAMQPATSRKVLYNTLIAALVAAGVWPKLDLLYLFAAADQATALTNLVQASFGATAVNLPAFTADRGFAGNGSSSYINSNFNPSAAGGHFALNSAHMSVWDLAAVPQNGLTIAGAYDGTNITYLSVYDGGSLDVALNSTTANIYSPGPVTQTGGFILGSRTAANSVAGYKNGASIGSSSAKASSVIPNLTLWACGRNSSGTLTGSTDQIGAFSAGSGLTATEEAALYNALHAWMQAVAGVA